MNLKIGIDPGINNGYALWNSKDKQFIKITSFPLYKLFEELNLFLPDEIFVVIENPNTWIPFKGADRKSSDAKKQGAGAVKQTYKHIIEYLEGKGIKYRSARLQGTLKKMDSATFKRYTGWDKATNQHGRDAGMMVWKS